MAAALRATQIAIPTAISLDVRVGLLPLPVRPLMGWTMSALAKPSRAGR